MQKIHSGKVLKTIFINKAKRDIVTEKGPRKIVKLFCPICKNTAYVIQKASDSEPEYEGYFIIQHNFGLREPSKVLYLFVNGRKRLILPGEIFVVKHPRIKVLKHSGLSVAFSHVPDNVVAFVGTNGKNSFVITTKVVYQGKDLDAFAEIIEYTCFKHYVDELREKYQVYKALYDNKILIEVFNPPKELFEKINEVIIFRPIDGLPPKARVKFEAPEILEGVNKGWYYFPSGGMMILGDEKIELGIGFIVHVKKMRIETISK